LSVIDTEQGFPVDCWLREKLLLFLFCLLIIFYRLYSLTSRWRTALTYLSLSNLILLINYVYSYTYGLSGFRLEHCLSFTGVFIWIKYPTVLLFPYLSFAASSFLCKASLILNSDAPSFLRVYINRGILSG
jgi:hypothetical protein